MKQVQDLYRKILSTAAEGEKENRTSVKTVDIFGHQMRFNLQEGFPLVTTKFASLSNIKAELIWFISGSTNVNDLKALYPKCNIWDSWCTDSGELGPVYGYEWNHNDQLNKVVEEIKRNPHSRRLIVSAWNSDNLPDPSIPPKNNAENGKAALPPCHCLFQFDVSRDKKLNCQLYQRSCDSVLGLPYNIASYAMLTHMVAKITGLEVGEFVWSGGNVHIYVNQIDTLIKEQLDREPLPLPTIRFNENKVYTKLSDFTMDDIWIENYQHHGVVKYPPAAI